MNGRQNLVVVILLLSTALWIVSRPGAEIPGQIAALVIAYLAGVAHTSKLKWPVKSSGKPIRSK